LERVELTPQICLTSSVLVNEYKISPFDTYYIAAAIARDKVILSGEHAYDRIKGDQESGSK
jgi:predicted nucleic acid-binding protein